MRCTVYVNRIMMVVKVYAYTLASTYTLSPSYTISPSLSHTHTLSHTYLHSPQIRGHHHIVERLLVFSIFSRDGHGAVLVEEQGGHGG